MVLVNPSVTPVILNNHITVRAAAELSGYSLQYLRRILRMGKLDGLKIGQVWLIEMEAFEKYLEKSIETSDRRFGPQ